MGAIAREASNCSTKFGPPTAARPPSYQQIFARRERCRPPPEIVPQKWDRLDILINNAGIGSGGSAGKRETSQDGHELRFAVNFLAGFLLTRVLLPLVMLGKPARIVNVSSLG